MVFRICKMAMKELDTFTIDSVNKQLHQPTLHPQVTVIRSESLDIDRTFCFSGNFYAVYFKQTHRGEESYGRQCMDFQYGTLVFAAPGEVIRIGKKDTQEEGMTGLLFHPELFSQKSLVFKKSDYSFFSYKDNESLHLSLQEKHIVLDCIKHIYEELQYDIDFYSLRLIATGIEMLLDYCLRFYERQFIMRSDVNRQYLSVLDAELDNYFSGKGYKSMEKGISHAIQSLPFLSTAYLNDLVRVETGETLAEHVRMKMMERIRACIRRKDRKIEDIAKEFGFIQPRTLILLYRKLFGHMPDENRLAKNYNLN